MVTTGGSVGGGANFVDGTLNGSLVCALTLLTGMFLPGLSDENSPEATTDALKDTPDVTFSASSQPAAPPNGHVVTGAAGPVGGSSVLR